MKKHYVYQTPLSMFDVKENMPSLIEKFNNDNQRELLYKDRGLNEIWIGIEKGDHAGYWFIASLEENHNGTKITGRIEYDPENYTADSKMNMFSKICTWIFLGLICLIFCIPIIIFQLYKLIKKDKTKEEYLDIFLKEYLKCEKIRQK